MQAVSTKKTVYVWLDGSYTLLVPDDIVNIQESF
jgi:hypothetical protein